MRFKNHFLIFLLFFISFKGMGTHIVGGEIYYDYLGSNNYHITLKVYRDCYNGLAPYDNPASVFIFNSTGILVDSVSIVFPGSVVLPVALNNPCFTPPTNVCVEEAIYDTILNLPPIVGGYDIVYARCCRNNTIMNLVGPGNVGSTYVAHIPDNTLAVGNSSARYNIFPPIFLCVGVPFTFDHSATDPNGDSLYYDFCDPVIGLDPTCPISGSAAAASGCPTVLPPPPYAPVPWLAPYSATYPLSSSPVLTINHQTGMMAGTPNLIGQWVVGVCVSEYRNGNLLDVNRRDFQFNVTSCGAVTVASIPSQTTFCFGYTVNFTQTSLGAWTYHWDFDDATTVLDTSDIFAPSYTYTDSGTYDVTLIINPGSTCADTGVTTFYIYPLLAPDFIAPAGECIFNTSFNFTASGSFLGNGSFNWNFGPNATPNTSGLQNPTNISFDTSGTFPVSLIVSENGCTDTITHNVEVYNNPFANFGVVSDTACAFQPVYFIDSSSGDAPFSYFWNFGDGGTSTLQNPSYSYSTTGTFTTNLVITSNFGCTDSVSIPGSFMVYPSPSADFIVTPDDTSIFYPDVMMIDQSVGGVWCEINWGDGSPWEPCDSTHHKYTNAGAYTVTQVVKNSYGCYDTAYYTVNIRPEYLFWLPNAFTPNHDGLNDVFKPSIFGVHNYSFMIFDRWGEKIFETNDLDEGWNGTFKGNRAKSDVYVYKINFGDDVENAKHQFIGRVTLIR